ncbi:MAG: hypothetical protein K6D97_00235, partial [Clostridia bacterium]|nr:hypothetical protein [Clostridia bacterium]
MNKLYLITNKFPYGKDTGEMYLNYEIKYLCQEFDEVSIISCTGKKIDGINLKELPKNLNVSLLEDHKSKYYYVFKSFGLFFKKKNREVKEELKSISLPRKLFLMSFIARAKNRLKKIVDLNIINNIDENDN